MSNQLSDLELPTMTMNHEPRLILHLLSQIEDLQKNNRRLTDQLSVAEKISMTDELTGLPNRLALRKHIEAAKGTDITHTLGMIDIDNFKAFNDTYGHLAGDVALQQVSEALQRVVNTYEGAFVARYGGEEFTVVAPFNYQKFGELSQFLLKEVRHIRNENRELTISIGSAQLLPENVAGTYQTADRNLYTAKTMGKDRHIG